MRAIPRRKTRKTRFAYTLPDFFTDRPQPVIVVRGTDGAFLGSSYVAEREHQSEGQKVRKKEEYDDWEEEEEEILERMMAEEEEFDEEWDDDDGIPF